MTTPSTNTTTRRSFFRTAALAAFAPAGCATLEGHGSPRYIDAHVHVWTPDLHAYPLAHGYSRKKDMIPRSFTPEQLFAHSRPEGVDRVVLIQMNFYEFDNRYMLDTIAQHPGVFRGVAIVDERKSDVCATMKSLKKQGVRGFRLYAFKDKVGTWEHSEGMKKMWTCAADEGLSMCLLADPESLPVIHRLCQAHPRTPVVIDHFARIGMSGHIHAHDLDRLCRLAQFAHVHVKTSAFYALGRKRAPYTDLAPMIHRLRDAYGAHRLMWASDCPFQAQEGHTYHNSIALIRDRLDFLSAEEKHWMLRKTAEKVFFA